MTDRPTTTPKDPRATRPGERDAGAPSETLGLPEVGKEASAAHFARDVSPGAQAVEDEKTDSHAPADPRDRAG